MGFDDVSVPTGWPSDKVALWIKKALTYDTEQSLLMKQEEQRAEEDRLDALRQMERLLDGEE